MPEDALVNGGALGQVTRAGARARVSGMQAKLHRWAAADPGRRFDDLFNLVHDPATLRVAFDRVASNTGARTAGTDGLTAARIEAEMGVPGFLEGIRSALRAGTFCPQPVRERKIPKPGGAGKVRKLGIPTVADRVVQAALKLVLEPIFEAGFSPASYGFWPRRRAHDAIAEIHLLGTKGYQWVLDADIEACFDNLSHSAVLERVRARIKDKRVLTLVKAFLKAGVLTELGEERDTPTGTPQGGILSPLLANIALTVLDEHLTRPWKPGGTQATAHRRAKRRSNGLANWRLVRYADDFVVLIRGERHHAGELREEIADVLARLGLRLSPSKTQVTHMNVGFDFLGFRIQRKRKRGTAKWYIYTFIATRPRRRLKAQIRALTPRTSQYDLKGTLIRINQITRGWSTYFQHAIAKRTFQNLDQFIWRRIVRLLMTRHRWNWRDLRRHLIGPNGRWKLPSADGIELFSLGRIPVTRYRYRGSKIPNPWATTAQPA